MRLSRQAAIERSACEACTPNEYACREVDFREQQGVYVRPEDNFKIGSYVGQARMLTIIASITFGW